MTYEPSLLEQYREMHRGNAFSGYSVLRHAAEIGKLIDKTGSRSLLDYGCGKGLQYTVRKVHKIWGIMPDLFDPATSNNTIPRSSYDGVICTDVAEHVPEEEIEAFLDAIFALADKFVFMTICTRPARKTLPNGQNCHVTVRSRQWWANRIRAADRKAEVVVKYVT